MLSIAGEAAFFSIKIMLELKQCINFFISVSVYVGNKQSEQKYQSDIVILLQNNVILCFPNIVQP